LWPGTVIGQAQPLNAQVKQPWNNDTPAGEMGTNGVFLGAHQGGDNHFTGQPAEKAFVPQALHAEQPLQINRPDIYANLAGNGRNAKDPRPLWPGTVIGQAQPLNAQVKQPWNNDTPAGEMGTNGVFLGAHQGGDNHFTGQPAEKAFVPQAILYQAAEQKQLWPSSVINAAPPQNDQRRQYPQTAADGSLF